MNSIQSALKQKCIHFLTLLHLYTFAKSISRKSKFMLNKKFLSSKRDDISKIIYTITESPSVDTVYIFQHSFFNSSGTACYSGGAERYISDLSENIRRRKYKIILFQIGRHDSKTPWQKHFSGMHVIGINGDIEQYFWICSHLPKPKLAIYSGFIEWPMNGYSNSILISHGITWDAPAHNANIPQLIKTLFKFNKIVSVDVNTISWFRSTYARYLANANISFFYIPNYVDLSKFTPEARNSSKLKITFPRRLSKERGFYLFAPIAKKILTQYRFVEIEFIGYVHDADMLKYLKKLKTDFGGRVSHRLISPEQMHTVYQQTDISVIPTLHSEGTSLSCLEAMACGNCIVTTNVGGLANLILPDFNGKLVNPNETELFNAICSVIEDKSLRHRLQANAILVAASFSKEAWTARWNNVLDNYI